MAARPRKPEETFAEYRESLRRAERLERLRRQAAPTAPPLRMFRKAPKQSGTWHLGAATALQKYLAISRGIKV